MNTRPKRPMRRIPALLAAGVALAVVAPTGAIGATKTTKKKAPAAKTTVKATTTVPATTRAVVTSAPTTTAAVKTGGSAIIGVDAETNNWLPGIGQWGNSGGLASGAVYDRWFSLGLDGKIVPNLALSATPSTDYRTWTFEIRPGIKFHNGEALDGAAFVANMDHIRTGSTTAPLFGNLLGCTASGQTATCTTRVPWVTFPNYFTGQTGAAAAPAQIRANDGRHLVGTGPFICRGDCWIPNQSLKLVKNPDYWRKGLPKLDAIEFRPIPDEDQRLAQLQSGQIQFLASVNFLTGRDLAKLVDDKKAQLITNEVSGSVSYDLVNMARRDSHMQDVRVRRAWAHAIDLETLIRLRAPGATPAYGPFSKGAAGYAENTGYPRYDPDKAKALLDEYKREKGITTVNVTYGSTNVSDNDQLRAVMKQMLDRVGFNINISPGLEQSAYIGTYFTGNYEVTTQTWLPYADPDIFRAFLSSDGCGGPVACPRTIGAQVLNWGRVSDAIVDTAFDQIRSNSDPVVRDRAAEVINRAYGENAYHLWRWRGRLHVASCAKCGGLDDLIGVGGEKLVNGATSHFLGTAWLTVG